MLRQSLSQKMMQKLSPQQIQLMKLLQLPTVALEQRIKEEMEGNPALDEGSEERDQDSEQEDYDKDSEQDDQNNDEFDLSDYMDDDDTPGYKLYTSNRGADADDKDIPFASGRSFHELLKVQLGLRVLDDREHDIAQFLVGNLDESGYLRRELSAIVDDLAFSQNMETTEEELLSLLNIIQEFDPAGIGARSLQECLLLQLDRKPAVNESIKIAKEVIGSQFEEFTKKHYNKILRNLGIDEEDLRNAIEEILKLNPKPGDSLSESTRVVESIVPDFIVNSSDGKLELSLNSRNAPELKISGKYTEMLKSFAEAKTKTRETKDAIMFVKQKLDSAKWFIDAIRQRQQTLLLTMDAIMQYQKDYFMEGDETLLKPMILKDIAEKVDLDISTISRVANSKYVQTPYGTFLLKTFFSESLSTDSGEEVSTREVKKILQELIDAEDKRKPLADDNLAKLLNDKGYNIARRTIAKYREQLKIPVARLRREI